jgi:hypothetical protein
MKRLGNYDVIFHIPSMSVKYKFMAQYQRGLYSHVEEEKKRKEKKRIAPSQSSNRINSCSIV